MLELENVSKYHGGIAAVENISLVFERGRTTVLIGPSGCGKSTLLRVITGLVHPDSGRVIFRGEEMSGERLESFRRRIGYVIQDGGLFPHMTGRDNVTIMAHYLDWLPSTIQERLDELSDLVKLDTEILARYPAEMSGGQRQRVGLMRSLMLDPEILLLDEPLASLDPMIRTELQADLKGIFRRLNRTVVFVTHDLNEAGYLGDAVVLLCEGRVVQQGGYRDLIERPAGDFVRRFIHSRRGPEIAAGDRA